MSIRDDQPDEPSSSGVLSVGLRDGHRDDGRPALILMRLPAEAFAELSQPHVRVHVGDVWWLPETASRYPGGKDRYNVIVALETPPGTRTPAKAHYIAGSTRSGGPPELIIDPGEAKLGRRTYFRFWWSGEIEIATLVDVGRYVGRLAPARRPEIIAAVLASKMIVLKRLVNG